MAFATLNPLLTQTTTYHQPNPIFKKPIQGIESKNRWLYPCQSSTGFFFTGHFIAYPPAIQQKTRFCRKIRSLEISTLEKQITKNDGFFE